MGITFSILDENNTTLLTRRNKNAGGSQAEIIASDAKAGTFIVRLSPQDTQGLPQDVRYTIDVDDPEKNTKEQVAGKAKVSGKEPEEKGNPFAKKKEGEVDPEEKKENPFTKKKEGDACGSTNNAEFSKRVKKKIADFVAAGKPEDEAAAHAFKETKEEMIHGDSLARLTRAGTYYYYEAGRVIAKKKDFDEIEKAVKELDGKPLPAFARHEDCRDINKSTGIYYNIVADPTTQSVYGKLCPDQPIGAMNSIGFMARDSLEADGFLHQVDIVLDHVAVSPLLEGRGGETVAVIDAMPADEISKQLAAEVEARTKLQAEIADAKAKYDRLSTEAVAKDAAIKAAADAKDKVDTERLALKQKLDKIEADERDNIVAELKRGMKKDSTFKFDAMDLASARVLKTFRDSLDGVEASNSKPARFFADAKKPEAKPIGNMYRGGK